MTTDATADATTDATSGATTPTTTISATDAASTAASAAATASTQTVEEPAKPEIPLRLLDLSVDIKTLIVAHVIRPTDMKNLCLTCKQMHAITARQLYHEVTLEVGSPTDTKLTAFINPRNIGLQYIRKMDLYLADVPDKCNQLQQAHFAIRMILEFLPEDILEKFSWHPWNHFSADNLLLLYRKQRRMKWLEAIALDKDVLPDLEKLSTFDAMFEHTRKLGLYPDSRDVLNYCAALVKRTPKVEKITLHASFDEDPDRQTIPSRELNDSSTGPGLITSTIFGHMLPFEKCTPLALRDLTLQKIHLRYAAETYCRFINFRNIKALRVFGCSGADSLFAELSKSQKLPERLESLEFKHDDNPDSEALNALDGFLCLVSGLKVLTLDICYAKTLPSSAGITRHAKTLRELNIHGSRGDGEEEELVYDFDDFEKICKSCTLLEQLSCAFPPTSLIRSNSDAFDQFERALGDLPNLITLNITTWPNNTPSSSRLPRKIYEHLLQGMAQAGFERSVQHAATNNRPSRLAVIAFGSSDKVYDREDSKNQIIFVKGKQFDPFGVEAPLAVQIGWCLRKFVEPRSDVLDFSLARSCRPPTREPPQSDESD
ncbi:hypothetical protein EJ06DRAFT_473503 [Trichodelitschia bisporula]|uniref:Uncharacterized protein n=1 Tax=Trichodelitschia bisporula TaxID=703511 RepID=A0A6G1I2B9_9PEZI|nr:hypothetical protein EJ06DRAFT_473503 [Trichodelitschia bisporula]